MNPDRKEDDKIVEFPIEEIDIPIDRLPQPIGRVAEGHPLRKPLLMAIIILVLLVAGQIIYTVSTAPPQSTAREEAFREQGGITYENERLTGWFIDPAHQHFEASDGREFTYVDPHNRENGRVSGHWREVE